MWIKDRFFLLSIFFPIFLLASYKIKRYFKGVYYDKMPL
jgi:hypothetical protein